MVLILDLIILDLEIDFEFLVEFGHYGIAVKEHCNHFKFVDDDDYDVISNVAPHTFIRSEEFNDPSTRVYEMDNEFQEHGRRLRKMEKKLNVVLYVIVFCIVLYFIM
ncbi:hypothetical protein CsSME_00011090 [Camellia sinensis var. sinensis]